MNPKFKLALYLVLGIGLAVCIHALLTAMREGATAPGSALAGTNAPSSTNVALTNVALTNAAATNLTATTNSTATNTLAADQSAAIDEGAARKASPRMGRFMAFGVAGFFALVGLAVLIGHDVSRFLATRVENFIFNEDLKGMRDPEYDEAEAAWAKGDYLGSIQLMRDYYKKNPREVHVALRIAEIYESNLGNYLAAALEYEDVLRKPLPAERWGWAAIHLANLYSGKLNKAEAATQLLRRIADEYGQTAAAKKARERLGIPEPVPLPEPPPEPEPEPEPLSKAASKQPQSNLPPGFRPK
jgi:TolA-binding protein